MIGPLIVFSQNLYFLLELLPYYQVGNDVHEQVKLACFDDKLTNFGLFSHSSTIVPHLRDVVYDLLGIRTHFEMVIIECCWYYPKCFI